VATFDHSVTQTDLLPTLLLILGLALVALAIVVPVLFASRRSLVNWRKLSAAFSVLVWVVPAIALVWVIGSQYRDKTHRAEMKTHVRQTITDGIRSIRTEGSASASAAPDLAARSPNADGPAAPTNPVSAEWQVASAHEASLDATEESDRARSPRLRVRRISSEDPKLTVPAAQSRDPNQFCLSSERYATLDEAETHLTGLVLGRVRELCSLEDPEIGVWLSHRFAANSQFLVDLVNQEGVKELAGEVIDWDFKNGTTGKMYRAHLRFDFSPELRRALRERWQGETAERRLLLLGAVVGLVTLMLGTAAGYFRLDDATGGAFRGRLKLAAAAIIAAGSVATVGAIRL
jgi:hypothetical protein